MNNQGRSVKPQGRVMKYAFQPIFDMTTREIYGYEALMRPVKRSPEEFIAESIAKSRTHDVEVMTFFTASARFKEANLGGRLFINSFPNDALNAREKEIFMEKFGQEFMSNIVVEILEYPGISVNAWYAKQRYIRHHGMQCAIDDLGSGINNDMTLLSLYDPKIIKLDRNLIAGIDEDVKKQDQLRNIIHMLDARNLELLAEGVETEGEYNYLKTLPIRFMQGYYLGRPKVYA